LELLQALSEESIPPFTGCLAIIASNVLSEDSFHSLYIMLKKRVLIDESNVPNIRAAMEFLSKISNCASIKKGSKRLLLFKTAF
jgi:hypothetical protein